MGQCPLFTEFILYVGVNPILILKQVLDAFVCHEVEK